MLYPLLIAFFLVCVSEMGDKTQLLVLSFSTKVKTRTILLGVALGSFLSHGIAILFGAFLGNIENTIIHNLLDVITYSTFIIFGIITLLSKEENVKGQNIIKYKASYILIIAFGIAVGELGDKTFLSSIGLGIQYPNYKISLIIGAILGMLVSDIIAIFFGRILSQKVSEKLIQKFSGLLFLLFGMLGLIF